MKTISKEIIELEEGLSLNLQFEKRGGLLPVAVQESSTGEILMLASINKDALKKSLSTKKATFWSTSRKKLWTKGETSGDYLRLDKVLVDCDQDAIVYKVTLLGQGVCHTFSKNGKHRKACFYRELNIEEENKLTFLEDRQ
jgi:phosphoribosyl-AMP cyclohydrolase